MFGVRHVTHLSELFAAQFTPQSSGFLYRRNHVGAGCLVTAAERDAFVAGYRRAWRRMFWGIMVSVVVLIGAMVTLFAQPSDGATIVATIGLIAVVTWLHLRS